MPASRSNALSPAPFLVGGEVAVAAERQLDEDPPVDLGGLVDPTIATLEPAEPRHQSVPHGLRTLAGLTCAHSLVRPAHAPLRGATPTTHVRCPPPHRYASVVAGAMFLEVGHPPVLHLEHGDRSVGRRSAVEPATVTDPLALSALGGLAATHRRSVRAQLSDQHPRAGMLRPRLRAGHTRKRQGKNHQPATTTDIGCRHNPQHALDRECVRANVPWLGLRGTVV